MPDTTLQTPAMETTLVMRLTAELAGLSLEARMRVLARIMAQLAPPAEVPAARVNSVQEIGEWQDDRPAEAIIADLYAARTTSDRPPLNLL